MAVDYDAWSDVENRAVEENTVKCFEELSKDRVIRLPSLFPELGLTSDDNYTMWHPPTSPEAKQGDPAANLGNLLVHLSYKS